MDFYVIPPLKYMELAKITGVKRLYALAHLCIQQHNDNWQQYIDFFVQAKKEGYWITLDNGAAENSLLTEDMLLNIVKIMQPNEVIAPDILYDNEQTKLATTNFIKKLKLLEQQENINVKVFGVPQGKNVLEYLDSYIWFLYNSDITTIGLSKLSVPRSFEQITGSKEVSVNRRYLIKLLHELQLICKPLHLLGMRNINEYEVYKGMKNIRSTDSCYTCLSAVNGIDLAEQFIDIGETPESYFYMTMTDEQYKLSKKNINTFKQIMKKI